MNLKSIISELMKASTYVSLKKHYVILWLYTFIIFATATVGHVITKQDGFAYGMIVGFVVSLVLWYQYGKKMVK